MSNLCRTAIGLRVKDGVVLAVEKLVTSKLLLPNANRRIETVDKHMGVVHLPPLPFQNFIISESRLPLDLCQMVVNSFMSVVKLPPISVKTTANPFRQKYSSFGF
jgi:hypothetical protein